MADLITPPSTSAPLTAEDAAIIRAEKQLDEDTRGRLVQMYGESKTALGKRIALQRPMRQAWRCPKCQRMSDDIRKVCGSCLAPEPNANTKKGGDAYTKLSPGHSADDNTQLRTIASTGRSYRQFNDPIGQPKASQATAARGAASTPAAATATQDYYDDEPECGDDEGPSCRPGGESNADAGDVGDALPEASTLNKEKHLPPEGGSPFTHFVALPIGKLPGVTPSAERLLASMRAHTDAIARQEATQAEGPSPSNSDADDDGDKTGPGNQSRGASRTHLSPQLITSAAKMHVTLLLLALPTKADVEFAKELLTIFADRWAAEGKAASGGDFSVRFKGLHVMPERVRGGHRGNKANQVDQTNTTSARGAGRVNPKKAAVVYMGLRDEASTAKVQRLQNLLHECFHELISEEHREEVERTKVNLHMTVMNKKWRKKGAKRPFDATSVLETFGDAVICEEGSATEAVLVPRVELNRMSNYDTKADTYFVEASVPI